MLHQKYSVTPTVRFMRHCSPPTDLLPHRTSGFSVSERYAEITRCGGQHILTTRLQPDPLAFVWLTLVRHFTAVSSPVAIHPPVLANGILLPSEWHMSHNAAFVCVNDTIHVFGGQYRNYSNG